MFVKIIGVILFTFLFQISNPNNQQTQCDKALDSCRTRYSDLDLKYRDIKRLYDNLESKCSSAIKEVDNLRAENRNLKTCQKERSELQEQVNSFSREIETLRAENDNLRQNVSEKYNVLVRENASLTSEVERLRPFVGENQTLRVDVQALRTDVEALRAENVTFKNENATFSETVRTLRNENAEKTGENQALQRKIASTNQEMSENVQANEALIKNLEARVQESSRLSKELENALLAGEKKPAEMLEQIKSSQEKLSELGGEPPIVNSDTDGKNYYYRDLVIGTLKLEPYLEVKVKNPFRVKATFEPRPILKQIIGDNVNTTWYLSLKCNPGDKFRMQYLPELNGNKEEIREINLGSTEEWVWDTEALENFNELKPDINVLIGYKNANEDKPPTGIASQAFFVKEKIEPGSAAVAFDWLKQNIPVLLGIIAAGLSIFAGFLGIKQHKLNLLIGEQELKIKELEAQADAENPETKVLDQADDTEAPRLLPPTSDSATESKEGRITKENPEKDM